MEAPIPEPTKPELPPIEGGARRSVKTIEELIEERDEEDDTPRYGPWY
jgi:hypothetical protein